MQRSKFGGTDRQRLLQSVRGSGVRGGFRVSRTYGVSVEKKAGGLLARSTVCRSFLAPDAQHSQTGWQQGGREGRLNGPDEM